MTTVNMSVATVNVENGPGRVVRLTVGGAGTRFRGLLLVGTDRCGGVGAGGMGGVGTVVVRGIRHVVRGIGVRSGRRDGIGPEPVDRGRTGPAKTPLFSEDG